MPILNLLSVGPGTFIYHLLVVMALQAMAGIALIEWRHTGNPDHRRILLAFGGLLALRIPLLIAEPLVGEPGIPGIIAPLLGGMEVASIVILGWAFLAPVLGRRVGKWVLLGGLGATLLCVVTFLPWWVRVLARFPNFLYIAFWQQPFWYAASVILTLSAVLILLPRRVEERPWLPVIGFSILSLGLMVLFASSLSQVVGWLEAGSGSTLIGLGRGISLLGYPFFAIAVYRSALQDMGVYRQELQNVSEEALHQKKGLLSLVDTGRIAGESLDLDSILQHLAESITVALDADRSAIFLTVPNPPDAATMAAQYTLLQREERPVAPLTFPLAEQPTLHYALQRRKQLILNAQTDNPRLQGLYKLLDAHEAGPTIVQPILRQRRVLGALVVGNDHSQRAFEPNQGRLCQSIAAQVAAAIENARLYRDLQAQAGQLAELLQSQEDEVGRRTAILESVAEGVLVGDREGHIVVINAAAERILGVPRQRILGRPFKQLTGHTTLNPEADWGVVAQSGAPLRTVFELEGKIVYVSAAPVLTPAGDYLGVVAILRDITRETEAERAKSEFITAISHELRTPLTAIRGYAEALNTGMAGPVSEFQARFLNIIRGNALRMASLSENLIAVSELEKGGLRLEYGATDLHLIVDEVVRSVRGQLEARQLGISLELDDALTPIEADAARVRQILDNLVSNAIRFTYPGGHITIGATPVYEDEGKAPTHCAIRVSDTGIGISPGEQTRIWERFYRPLNPLAAEASGLGVGLSIVKSLVEAHGGRVWLESAPGVGSTFTVLLPVKRGTR